MTIKFPRCGSYSLSIRNELGNQVHNRTTYIYTNQLEVPESWMSAIDKGYYLFINDKIYKEFKSE